MYQTKITFQAEPTDANSPIGFEAWVNDHLIYDTSALTGPRQIDYDIDGDDASHQLRFVLKHKAGSQTQLDENNRITRDSCITVKNVCMDGINIDVLMNEKAVYQHDFNGTGPSTQEKFYGTMGCNGTVTLDFTTPIHVWLLDNM